MASSAVSPIPGNLRGLAESLGFDEIRVEEDLASMSTRVMVVCGSDRRVFNISDNVRHGNERALVYALEKLARSMEHNNRTNLDMRFNSIETMDDYRALLHHAHRANRKPEIVWLTPEQKQTLLAQVEPSMISSMDGQNVQLYGCLLRVEPV